MPGRDYEIILFKIDFCPAPNKHSELGWGPQQRETGSSVSTSNVSWGGTTKLFIQIRFLSRFRSVNVSVDNPAFMTPLIGCPEYRNFMSQSHRGVDHSPCSV
ncbi:hypothetical protein [Staphylococcus marylandisciuri]|uniref:hypothetical protein n=1 Tax=Staphylococcus marylandisciuri TaxID=2981529 RepID=UPI0021CF5CD1|nr:hypothetical protein [Staphylococcus marylandisciuri]